MGRTILLVAWLAVLAIGQGCQSQASAGSTPAVVVAAPAAVAPKPTATVKGSVMLVEAGEKPQQALRELFTKLGYRVLLTENPQRALARFQGIPAPADVLVISARELGAAALDAFNRLSSESYLSAVPAVLLASPRQTNLIAAAKVDERRRIVSLPLQGDELAKVVAEIVPKKS